MIDILFEMKNKNQNDHKGVAEVLGISLGDIVVLNLFYEFSACVILSNYSYHIWVAHSFNSGFLLASFTDTAQALWLKWSLVSSYTAATWTTCYLNICKMSLSSLVTTETTK